VRDGDQRWIGIAVEPFQDVGPAGRHLHAVEIEERHEEVHAEAARGAAGELVEPGLEHRRRDLRQREHPEPAGVGDGGGQVDVRHEAHAGQLQRLAASHQIGEPGARHDIPLVQSGMIMTPESRPRHRAFDPLRGD
jgi:hypothetical protein